MEIFSSRNSQISVDRHSDRHSQPVSNVLIDVLFKQPQLYSCAMSYFKRNGNSIHYRLVISTGIICTINLNTQRIIFLERKTLLTFEYLML